jgi:ATP-dependent Clp protease protease subunit
LNKGELMRRKDDLEMLHDNDIYVPRRLIMLDGEIDEFEVATACKNLVFLDCTSQEPITLRLNTPGGDVYNGLGLYDTIKACRSHVTVIANGHLMSMGTIILQAADERILTPNCRVLMHHGSAGVWANSKDMIAAAKDVEELMKRTNQIMLKRIREKKPRYTMSQLDKLLTVDKYMWPKEFVDMGLADKVVGEE